MSHAWKENKNILFEKKIAQHAYEILLRNKKRKLIPAKKNQTSQIRTMTVVPKGEEDVPADEKQIMRHKHDQQSRRIQRRRRGKYPYQPSP